MLVVMLVSSAATTSCPKLCQLNGVCRAGVCACDPGWKGSECGRLDLLPASLHAGLQLEGMSSWGGSIAYDEKRDEFVMIASIFRNGCGLNSWATNSALVRASSRRADGRYKLDAMLKPHFAHSPSLVRLPTPANGLGSAAGDRWLCFHIGAGLNQTHCPSDPNDDSCQLVGGCQGGCSSTPRRWRDGLGLKVPVAVLAAPSLDGPWREVTIGQCESVPDCPVSGNDINPAPLIDATTGRVTMLWRSINRSCDVPAECQSYISTAHAPSWDGPYTWDPSNIFDGVRLHIEDGFLWRNGRGEYHALLHADVEKSEEGAAGVHAWSADGVRWSLSRTNAFGRTIELRSPADPPQLQLARRERPKLLLDADGLPAFLITSAMRHGDCDRTFTFVQPIAGVGSPLRRGYGNHTFAPTWAQHKGRRKGQWRGWASQRIREVEHEL